MSRPQPDHGSTTSQPLGTPRWVKMFGIVALVVILLVFFIMVALGGNHGPSRHLPSSGRGDSTSPRAHQVYQP